MAFTTTPALAIAEALRFNPDVVICDIYLPTMDGCAFAHELLALSGGLRGTRPLLIALTGQGDETRDRCLASGFDFFFRKPANPGLLEALLEEYARSRVNRLREAQNGPSWSLVG